jgi:hypothetical protein
MQAKVTKFKGLCNRRWPAPRAWEQQRPDYWCAPRYVAVKIVYGKLYFALWENYAAQLLDDAEQFQTSKLQ